jgi:aminopeptidase YwaD
MEKSLEIPMNTEELIMKAGHYLNILCKEIAERSVGTDGNRKATAFFEKEISSFGWETERQEFQAMDWEDGGARLLADSKSFDVLVSPYSPGIKAAAVLTAASTITELESLNAKDKIILLHGEIAREQLMPKNFVFYNPEHHQKTISLLENGGAKAIIAATGRNASLAGGVYPFPLIEDGDFNVSSVYMTEEEGLTLLPYVGKEVKLESISKRINGNGCNVVARKGSNSTTRIAVTAHIDAKKGIPGAIDNATGVVILLLLAELLRDYAGEKQIEIVAFNGEDYYAVPGQMLYIAENQGQFDDILLNINIDGAGYIKGDTAFSFFGLSEEISQEASNIIDAFPDISEGVQWPQGDHSIFVQFGRPAIAVSSQWFINNIDTQDITHTPKDNVDIVDINKLPMIAKAIKRLLEEI